MDTAAATLAATARAQFAAALSSLPPVPKRLYIDDDLYCTATSSAPLLTFFTTADTLRKSHLITHILPLSAAAAHPTPAPGCSVFLLRPSALPARHVAAALAAAPGAAGRSLVLVTPRRSRVVERVLTAAIATGTVRVAVLALGFLPFDDALVTLCWPRAFSQVVLEGNNSVILGAAAALRGLGDAIDADFDVIRTAGAAGAAVAEEYLIAAGRKVHAKAPVVDASEGYPEHAVGGQGAAGKRDGDDAASIADGEGDGAARGDGQLAAIIPRELFGADEVSIGRVLAGTHLPSYDDVGATDDTNMSVSSSQRSQRKRSVTLVIIDRNVDVVTPLLTQWTYEGLLDEAVGLLRGNVMDVGVDEFTSTDAAATLGGDKPAPSAATADPAAAEPQTSRRVQKRLRREGDPIFGQLRDLNYWAAARLLTSVASSVRAYYDARPGRDTAEIGKVKDYVRGLREVKSEHHSAAVHTAIAEEISARTFEKPAFKRRFELEREMLEGNSASGRRVLVHDAISRCEPLPHILRLCCLWSLTGGGVEYDAFEFLRREIIATYGLKVLPLLGSLERSGLLARAARVANTGAISWTPFGKFGFGGGGNDADADADAGSAGSRGGAQGGGSGSGPGGVNIGSGGGKTPVQPQSSVVGYSWQFVRAAMHLVTDFAPEAKDSGGISGPYSGYIPLTVRLMEAGVSDRGWGRLPRFAAHTLLLPPGHALGERSVASGTIAERTGPVSSPPQERVGGLAGRGSREIEAVVLFVGGVARAEASAVRAAAAKAGKKVLIATTDVMGPDQFSTMS